MHTLTIRFIQAGTLVLCLLAGCSEPSVENNAPPWDGKTRFEALPPEVSGVEFANTLDFDEDFNIYTYRNFYNGGGVALGDVNNDGLTDIYLSGNRVANRLFLNRGGMKFEDVTEAAGVGGQAAWSTGVTMADVNADGWLDIYVCNSGDIAGDNRRNELYINQQDGTFTEAAADYGLDNEGLSTHGVFFDYDRDGDLDFYLLNNSYQAIGSFNLEKNERPKRDSVGGDRLYENRDGYFYDVSETAGIYGSIIGFGLGVTVGDVDRDGWPDIFVSNDFFERDYLYMNNGDGTFREVLTNAMSSISAASMGADLADINNDGYSELFVTEMLPASNRRMKEATTFENWNRYQYNLKNDYFHQFTRNVLQRNNGDGTFTEIGRLSGVEATDWSWGALIFDMDNDGYKDIYVANGIYQDLTNRDFLDYIADDEFKRKVTESGEVDFRVLVDAIPSNPVPNVAYRNLGPSKNFRFENVAASWGLDLRGFTNGSAYADLDNDGDLDLVVNNTNAAALVYRNHTEGQHYLQLEFRGKGGNTFGVGTKATVVAGDRKFYLEFMPMRGFESSMQYRLHFGLGEIAVVDRIDIEWPDGKQSSIVSPAVNQLLTVAEDQTGSQLPPPAAPTTPPPLITGSAAADGIDFEHRENRYSDFDRDPLTYFMLSADGPALCSGDLNGDGRPDVYLGGARDQAGGLFLSRGDQFVRAAESLLEADRTSEDVACTCFDADGDGDLDLYVASGSSEFGAASSALFDRLYLNDGNRWTKNAQILPSARQPVVSSTVAAHDFDGDGDTDLFVGARMRPALYGAPADSYLLVNDGWGRFTERQFEALGMVTAAAWVDVSGDAVRELVVVGEYMAPRAFSVSADSITEVALPGLNGLMGWYTALATADLDGDGREDIILGNHGLNSRFRASPERPVMMHVNDFDGNGTAEQVVSTYEDGKAYPTALLHDLVKQMPGLRKRFLKYTEFGDKTMEDIFGAEALDRSIYYAATELRSLVIMNRGADSLEVRYLPFAAQETPVRAILADDVDGDGDTDLLLGGNFDYVKPEIGRFDAGRGLLLTNDGRGHFSAVRAPESGIDVAGEIRGIARLSGGRYLLARNNAVPIMLRRR
ncbi:VCBS repeat-containing protein [Lewinella sp. JB7]|uniref:VCBS repeat-containing protein n=1 Tax=Lewinella sp. JB7 TaxID=2962887 RepID=UPI0020C9ED47|nr:VCBS repeat-containing protein [Lewinella sp. JB7]MCP9237651.1 VCBS repeat-containing protein [Lewinella sp. JB7]